MPFFCLFQLFHVLCIQISFKIHTIFLRQIAENNNIPACVRREGGGSGMFPPRPGLFLEPVRADDVFKVNLKN